MKSKIDYTKIFLQFVKENNWLILLNSILYFVCVPITYLVYISGLSGRIEEETYMMVDGAMIQANFDMLIDESAVYFVQDYGNLTTISIIVLVLALFVGVIFALHSFHYLHNKSQVGAIHSLPIRRELLYALKIESAVFSYCLPIIANFLVAIIIALMYDAYSQQFLVRMGIVLLYSIGYFLLGYMLSTIAILLTGRIFVAVFGVVVFLGYGPFLSLIIKEYSSIFYRTYSYYTKGAASFLLEFTPFSLLLDFNYKNPLLALEIIAILLVVVVIGLYLMKIRKSEAAGRSMASDLIGGVVKVFLTIPIALAVGLVFYIVTYEESMTWIYLGTVLGVLIFYIIIQLIYGVDFKDLFKKKLHFISLNIVSIIIVVLFVLNASNYDNYCPEQKDIKNINVLIDGYPLGNYVGQSDLQDVYDMGNSKELYDFANAAIDSARTVDENDSLLNVISIDIKYELLNGTEVYRTYKVNPLDISAEIRTLWKNDAFIKNIEPLRTFEEDEIKEVSIHSFDEYSSLLLNEFNYLKFDESQEIKEEFVRLLIEDIKSMTNDELLNAKPIGEIHIITEEEQGEDWGQSEFIASYIYDECTNALQYLESQGIEVSTTIEASMVESLSIYYSEPIENVPEEHRIYLDSMIVDETKKEVITNPEEIEELTDKLITSRFPAFKFELEEGMAVEVKYKQDNSGDEYGSQFYLVLK